MDSRRLKKYRNQLQSKVPLLGSWLKGQAVAALTEDGSAEAIRLLAETVLNYSDTELGTSALQKLEQLARGKNVPAQEALCRLVMANGHAEAARIVEQYGYVPHDETRRALFFFLSCNWDEYEKLDFNLFLLRQAYEAADARLRRRIASMARRAGRLEWVEVVTGTRQPRRLALMSDGEWRTAL